MPDRLADVAAGEAVLVDWGRRRALGIVLGDASPPAGVVARPLAARVRSDGPLLPALALTLAREVAARYLAPPAMVLRTMLPPEMLERLELVATALDGGTVTPRAVAPAEAAQPATPRASSAEQGVLAALAAGPRPVRELPAPDGRAALLRRVRALEAAGRLHLEWTLTEAGAGPRFERIVRPTSDGLAATAGVRAPGGRPLGPRQRALLDELAAAEEREPGEPVPAPPLAARYGTAVLPALARRGLITIGTRERPRAPLAGRGPGARGGRPPGSALTPAQAGAAARVVAAIAARDATPLLLDGTTAAGKTAVYLEGIAACLRAGRPALVLVPEIALALPLVDRIRAELEAEVAVLHSALGAGERADEWRRVRARTVDVVVGTRLAVLAPLADVGLVVVDEEHEAAYKSDRTPRLQARDTAVLLGRLAGAAVVLGSATPSVESVGNARLGHYRRCTLGERTAGAAPSVELVDLRAELAAGNRALLSGQLAAALGALDVESGNRAILVINRRGAATVVLCRECGHVQACPECTRPLVYHEAGRTLRCHHCGAATPPAARCPACSSPRIRYLGGGTERLEAEVRSRFPALRVGRLDRDIVEQKGVAARVVDAFAAGDLDVLVGTSLVAKGLDVPEVTLVGVVSADIALSLPDERAAERTWQLLVQAIGRAGRGARPGRAIVQTYQPGHPVIRAVIGGDAEAFYDSELALRRAFGGPPYGRNLKLTVALEDAAAARREAEAMASRLRERAEERGTIASVIGPAPAYVPRRAGRWRWNVVIRADDPAGLLDGDPGPPWSVDVDPESLL
ncbi:MAG: primosomal protein [Chloroflexi bacterium]|nr:primosomal protein [Chloroflexota bacterium]